MKRIVRIVVVSVLLLAAIVAGGSLYMLSYSLRPDATMRAKNASSYEYMYGEYPFLRPWVDSLERTGALRDTVILGSEGERLHAIYAAAPRPTDRTAVIVHGYTDNAVRMLMIGYLYNRDLGCNILLPDLKYGLEEPARRYSHAPDYFPVATEAIREMFRQVGPCRMEDGLLRQGVVIRHLVLPGQLESTRRVIDWVARTFRPGEVLFSLMSQYTPQPGAEGPLRRHVTAAEYRAAAEYMENCGIVDGFVQERTSAREEYTPAFDLTGV